DVQPAGVDLDLVPLQIAKLGSSKPVAVGQQDHGGVPVAIAAVLARGLHELLDLAACEGAPGADNWGIYNVLRFAMNGANVFPLSVNYPVHVFFERKTGQAPLGAGYRGSIIWSRAFRATRGSRKTAARVTVGCRICLER